MAPPLIFSPSSPSIKVETIRHLPQDRTSLIIDAISIRNNNLHHRSRSFFSVYFAPNSKLNIAGAIYPPHYRTKDETIRALSAINMAVHQLLWGLTRGHNIDTHITQAIIRTDCKLAIHVLSARASCYEAARRRNDDWVDWDWSDLPEDELARCIETSVFEILGLGVDVRFWIVDVEDMKEAGRMAEEVERKRSRDNVVRLSRWLRGH